MRRPEQQSKNTQALQPLLGAVERQGKLSPTGALCILRWQLSNVILRKVASTTKEGKAAGFLSVAPEIYLFCFPQFHQCSGTHASSLVELLSSVGGVVFSTLL